MNGNFKLQYIPQEDEIKDVRSQEYQIYQNPFYLEDANTKDDYHDHLNALCDQEVNHRDVLSELKGKALITDDSKKLIGITGFIDELDPLCF